jgi:hypothetical protein
MSRIASLNAASPSPGVGIVYEGEAFSYEGGATLTVEQVLMLDRSGQLDWVSPAVAEWARKMAAPAAVPQTAAAAPVDSAKKSPVPKALLLIGGGLVVTIVFFVVAFSLIIGAIERADKPDLTTTTNTGTPIVVDPGSKPPVTPTTPTNKATAEEEAYGVQVSQISRTATEKIVELINLMNTDSEGMISGGPSATKAAGIIAAVQKSYVQAQALTPPASMAAIHEKLLACLKDWSDAMGYLKTGTQKKDSAAIGKSEDLIGSGTTKMNEFITLYNEFAASKQ